MNKVEDKDERYSRLAKEKSFRFFKVPLPNSPRSVKRTHRIKTTFTVNEQISIATMLRVREIDGILALKFLNAAFKKLPFMTQRFDTPH